MAHESPHDSPLHSCILEHCTDAILAHTLDGMLLYANPAALEQWGCSSVEEVRARGPWGWIAPEHHSKIAQRIRRLRLHGEVRFDEVSRSRGEDVASSEIHARHVDGPAGSMIVSVVRDISSRLQSEEMVRYLAYHDPLTGLANRALFGENLTAALAASDHHGDLVGLLYIDLDDFKPVNDVHGHAVGDNVLRKIAGRISSCVRQSDTVARIGGDEFTVLLPKLRDVAELEVIRTRIRDEIGAPIRMGAATVVVSASIGSATHECGESLDEFVARADSAMFDYRNREGKVPSCR